jgi:hypothetical protein
MSENFKLSEAVRKQATLSREQELLQLARQNKTVWSILNNLPEDVTLVEISRGSKTSFMTTFRLANRQNFAVYFMLTDNRWGMGEWTGEIEPGFWQDEFLHRALADHLARLSASGVYGQ